MFNFSSDSESTAKSQRARVFTRVVAQVSLPPSSAGIVNCTQAHSSTPITASTTHETTHELQPPSALIPCKVTSPSICCMRATDPKPPLSPSLIPLADRLHGKPSVGGSHRWNRKGRSGEGFSATYWNINSEKVLQKSLITALARDPLLVNYNNVLEVNGEERRSIW